jgi:hypothetical protein
MAASGANGGASGHRFQERPTATTHLMHVQGVALLLIVVPEGRYPLNRSHALCAFVP